MEKNAQKKVSGLSDADVRRESALLMPVPWCTGLAAFQAETVREQVQRGGRGDKDVGNNRGCHHHRFGPRPRQEKTPDTSTA